MVPAALLAALFAAVGTEVMLDYETNDPLVDGYSLYERFAEDAGDVGALGFFPEEKDRLLRAVYLGSGESEWGWRI